MVGVIDCEDAGSLLEMKARGAHAFSCGELGGFGRAARAARSEAARESAQAGEGGAVGMGAAAESAFAPESGCGCAEGGVDGFFVHIGGGLAAGEE